jgi:hypothetical protein
MLRTTVRRATLALALGAALLPACDQLEKLKNKGADAGSAVADADAAGATAVTTPPGTPLPTAAVPTVAPVAPLGGGAAPGPAAVRLADGGALRIDGGAAATVDAGAIRAPDGGVTPAPTPTPGGMKVPTFPFDAGAFKPPPGFTIPTTIPTTFPTFPPPAP